MGMQSRTAIVVTQEHEIEVPIELIQIGDELKLVPGGGVPVDGEVLWGHTYIDESILT